MLSEPALAAVGEWQAVPCAVMCLNLPLVFADMGCIPAGLVRRMPPPAAALAGF